MFRLNIPVCRHPISTVSYYASPCASLGRRIPVLSRFGLSSRSNDLPNVLFELDFIVRAKSRTDTLLEQVFFSISLRSARRIPVLSRFGLSSRSNDLPNVLFEHS